jgi:cobalt/nickel transport system permease protein
MNASNAAAWKLVGLFAVLAFIAVAPPFFVALAGGIGMTYTVMGGIESRRFLRRLTPILAITAVMAAGSVWSRSFPDDERAFQAAFRALVAGCLLVAFSERTAMSDVLLGMKRLRLPSLLVTSLMLMLRSLDILNDERRAILRSRAARGGEKTSMLAEWRGRAGLVGLLLMRAVDRSERIHRAMKSRGWAAERG